MTAAPSTSVAHADLMDTTYRRQRHIYDVTRKYFLLGRDHLIRNLDPPAGGRVLELACGTGRNLARIGQTYPGRRLYGLDISAEMLRSASDRLGRSAFLAMGDASSFDGSDVFGTPRFDRIVLSYSLSMIPDWPTTVRNAVRHLAPNGQLHIVDFGGLDRLPGWFRAGLFSWLGRFHVQPRLDLHATLLATAGADLEWQALYRGYAQYAIVRSP
jgi:S-adenosylmethionine-diacylgycerolhomoserine-N-methlytransferase